MVQTYKVQFSNDTLLWKPCMNGSKEAVSEHLLFFFSSFFPPSTCAFSVANTQHTSFCCRYLKETRTQKLPSSLFSTHPQWHATFGSTHRRGIRMGRRETSASGLRCWDAHFPVQKKKQQEACFIFSLCVLGCGTVPCKSILYIRFPILSP